MYLTDNKQEEDNTDFVQKSTDYDRNFVEASLKKSSLTHSLNASRKVSPRINKFRHSLMGGKTSKGYYTTAEEIASEWNGSGRCENARNAGECCQLRGGATRFCGGLNIFRGRTMRSHLPSLRSIAIVTGSNTGLGKVLSTSRFQPVFSPLLSPRCLRI